MKDILEHIQVVSEKLGKLENHENKDILVDFSNILMALTEKVEEVIHKQEYLEENMGYIGDDLTDIQEELFEEVSFDELVDMETEYVEISCKHCGKPIFIEKEAINDKNLIPCPFCQQNAI